MHIQNIRFFLADVWSRVTEQEVVTRVTVYVATRVTYYVSKIPHLPMRILTEWINYIIIIIRLMLVANVVSARSGSTASRTCSS